MPAVGCGGDQSDGMQVHSPEVCYPTHGFELVRVWSDALRLPDCAIPVMCAMPRLGSSKLPLTYCITNGDCVTPAGFGSRGVQLQYPLRGKIYDGMLVHASSFKPDAQSRIPHPGPFFARDGAGAEPGLPHPHGRPSAGLSGPPCTA